jgi:hypothetical protein
MMGSVVMIEQFPAPLRPAVESAGDELSGVCLLADILPAAAPEARS